MAVVKSPLLRKARGKAAGYSYLSLNGQTIMREASTQSVDAKTSAQMSRRVRLANLVTFYRAGSSWMPKGFATKKRTLSDFNAFVRVNLNNSTVALTKDMAAAGACVVAPYQVSSGSLPSIAVYRLAAAYRTNIRMGVLSISEATTIGQFASALIGANSWINKGDQLSFVSYQQITDEATSFPRVVCTPYEVTLDPSDERALSSVMPAFCASTVTDSGTKYLGTNDDVADGGFVYVLSRNTRRGLQVSSQTLTMASTAVYDQYSTDAAVAAAMESYGVDAAAFLAPGEEGRMSDPGAIATISGLGLGLQSIAGFSAEGMKFTAMMGVYVHDVLDPSANIMSVYLSAPAKVTAAKFTTTNNSIAYPAVLATQVSAVGGDSSGKSKYWGIKFAEEAISEHLSHYLMVLTLTLDGGQQISIQMTPDRIGLD